MNPKKGRAISCRFSPEATEALDMLAEEDFRSPGALIEKIVTEHLRTLGYLVPVPQGGDDSPGTTSQKKLLKWVPKKSEKASTTSSAKAKTSTTKT